MAAPSEEASLARAEPLDPRLPAPAKEDRSYDVPESTKTQDCAQACGVRKNEVHMAVEGDTGRLLGTLLGLQHACDHTPRRIEADHTADPYTEEARLRL